MTVSIMVLALLVSLIVALATIGAFALGLWFGERGRRKDAQRREGTLMVDKAPRAKVVPPGDFTPEGVEREIGEAPPRWLAECMDETGCTEEEAREEWRTLLAQSQGERPSGWIQDTP